MLTGAGGGHQRRQGDRCASSAAAAAATAPASGRGEPLANEVSHNVDLYDVAIELNVQIDDTDDSQSSI
eukprot:scaffold139649_cov17-Prasinocladus_malaysianus.AAC.1